ncbi:MAG: aldehyde reductase [Chloroflexi bacterium]|nr:MAG: aldehyde reductase [Chloroflexota bacterium]MBL1195259.1 aldehyde reductase [Chloroflexota bacterium]NOH12545.1 aldehyde reductase [Chloroflexota bacterium]
MVDTVCVTGASGYIAAHIVKDLLEQGYEVRGTVRSNPEKYDYLTSLPGANERLTLVEGELLTEGSYDEAVSGCDYVIHVASPYRINVKDPQTDLVDPALKGTLNVLRSCQKAGSIKRVVLTSSGAAITDEAETGKLFSEDDWNEKSTLQRNPYSYSKVKAEKAAWDFIEKEKPSFDLVVINPTFVTGPSLGPGLNSSPTILRDMMVGGYPAIMSFEFSFVDVRDVAVAHRLAMENKKASGRYICANETRSVRQIVELLKAEGYSGYKLPVLDLTSKFGNRLVWLLSFAQPRDTGTFMRLAVGKESRYDNSKIKRDLGMEFLSVEQSILETVEDLLKWGHLDRRTT